MSGHGLLGSGRLLLLSGHGILSSGHRLSLLEHLLSAFEPQYCWGKSDHLCVETLHATSLRIGGISKVG